MLGNCECLQPQCIWHSCSIKLILLGLLQRGFACCCIPSQNICKSFLLGGMEGAGWPALISAALAPCSWGAPLFFPKGSSVDSLPGLGALHLVFF